MLITLPEQKSHSPRHTADLHLFAFHTLLLPWTSTHFTLTPHRVVARSLSSARILEDDTDWDVRIRAVLTLYSTDLLILELVNFRPLLGHPGPSSTLSGGIPR